MNDRQRAILLEMLAEELDPLPISQAIRDFINEPPPIPPHDTLPPMVQSCNDRLERNKELMKIMDIERPKPEVKMESLNDAELRKIMHDNATMPVKIAMRAVADAATRKAFASMKMPREKIVQVSISAVHSDHHVMEDGQWGYLIKAGDFVLAEVLVGPNGQHAIRDVDEGGTEKLSVEDSLQWVIDRMLGRPV